MAGPSYSPGPGFGAFVNQLANPPNPMDQLGKTVNALTAMKNYQAQQASENAVQQSVDPVTGQVDMGKYNALLSQSPGAFNFSPLARQAGEAVGAQGQATSANVKANLDQLDAIGRLTEPLYKQAIGSNPSYVNPADAQAAVDQAYQMHLITPQQHDAYTSTLKSSQNAASWVIGANTGLQANRDLVLGRPGMADVGATVQPYQPVPGALPSAAPPMQKTLAPGDQARIAQWLDAPRDPWTDPKTGLQKQGTNRMYFADMGYGDPEKQIFGNVPGAPGAAAAPAAGGAGPASTVTTGRAPVPQRSAGGAPVPQPPPPGEPRDINAPTPPVAPPTGGGQELPPAGNIQDSQKAYTTDQGMQRELPNRISPLQNVLSVLRANPDLETAGVATLNKARQDLASYGIELPGGMNNANAYQEVAKYLAQYTRGLPGSNRSDLAAMDAAAATPHLENGRDAIMNLAAKAIGNERLRVASVDYFNQQYPDNTQAMRNSGMYLSKTGDWTKNQDPVAYAIDEMTPEAIGKYYSGLSNQAKQRFLTSAKQAKALYPSLAVNQSQQQPAAETVTTPPPLPAGVP